MIVMELTAAKDIHGNLETLYFSVEAFVTEATDTPPNTAFEPRLIEPGSISLHAYASGQTTTGGGVKLDAGETTLANADGALDYLLNYGFDGQTVLIRSGEPGTPYPSAWRTLFYGTAENIDSADWGTLVLRLRDRQYILEVPAQTNTYAGTNALPLGIEGTPDDIMGKPKPRVWGRVFQISPELVNTSKLTYQISDGALSASTLVYDRGVMLSTGNQYATSAALQAAATTPGSYDQCVAEGLFQLGADPAGTVTADAAQGANPAARTVAQTLKALALAAGVAPSDISAADVAALDAANNGEVGIFLKDGSKTYLSLMDEVAASIGAWFGFDANGVLRMGRLTEPAGTPVATYYDFDVAKNIERRPAYDNNIPVWWVDVKHTKVWTTQTDLAGSVPASLKAYLAEEFRSATYQDATVKQWHALATKLEIESLFTSQVVAAAEAQRQYLLYSVRRDIFEFTIPISLLPDNLNFMDVIQLVIPRYGMSSGKLFRLIGISYQLKTNQAVLSVWG